MRGRLLIRLVAQPPGCCCKDRASALPCPAITGPGTAASLAGALRARIRSPSTAARSSVPHWGYFMNTALSAMLRRGVLPVALLAALVAVLACAAAATVGDDTPTLQPGAVPPKVSEEDEHELLERDFFFESRRLAGDVPLSNQQAGALRAEAAHTANRLRKEGVPPSGPTTFTGPWTGIGPNPVVQVTRSTPILTPTSG